MSRIQSSDDARLIAKRRLPWMVFDYIDGSAGRETGAARARVALDNTVLRPRILKNVSNRNLGTDLFGTQTKAPFGIAPMGMCNLSAPGADLMLARLAARENVPVGVSTVASTALEQMIETAQGNAWFQLYFSGDGVGTFKLVERAKAAQYQTLVVNPEDAVQARDAGVDAVQVSSHGARQLEAAPAPIHALAAIRTAVGPDFPLFFDSGIRGGEDVVKAYANGADFTLLGRIMQFAIAAEGEEGLNRLW